MKDNDRDKKKKEKTRTFSSIYAHVYSHADSSAIDYCSCQDSHVLRLRRHFKVIFFFRKDVRSFVKN